MFWYLSQLFNFKKLYILPNAFSFFQSLVSSSAPSAVKKIVVIVTLLEAIEGIPDKVWGNENILNLYKRLLHERKLKSVNPKISRIGRQKRKNEFFLIWSKEPIWLPVFGNGIKRFDFLFFSSKFAKLENSAT